MQINKEKPNDRQLPIYNPQKEELRKSYLKKGAKAFLFCK